MATIFLDVALRNKYRDLPKKGKMELKTKFRSRFDYETDDRFQDLVTRPQQAPSVDERAWLTETIEIYYANYYGTNEVATAEPIAPLVVTWLNPADNAEPVTDAFPEHL